MVNIQAGTSFNVIKRYWYIAIALLVLSCFVVLHIPFVSQKIQSYAISSTEDILGGRSLAQNQEQKIKDIAQKLGITQTINIRRMNSSTLQRFGYHNAFAYEPTFLSFIPIGNQSFMYISEGFFEDLSEQEQIFLIGHELVHIKESHVKGMLFCMLLWFIIISLIAWTVRNRIRALIVKWFPHYASYLFWCAIIGLWFALASVGDVAVFAYMRRNERIADIEALTHLSCYEGLLNITDRWQKEFKMPLHNNYYGLFTDHPSVAERKAYCLQLQQKLEGNKA